MKNRVYRGSALVVAALVMFAAGGSAKEYPDWEGYPPMFAMNGVVGYKGAVYGMAKGGIFRYDPETRAYTLFYKNHGLPAIDAKCAVVAGNSLFAVAFQRISYDIRQGKTFSACLRDNSLFPPFMVQMAVIGEEGGTLPAMMSRAAKYYSDRVAVFVERLGVIIEPMILLIIGGIVGVLAVGMFLPLIRMSSAIH